MVLSYLKNRDYLVTLAKKYGLGIEFSSDIDAPGEIIFNKRKVIIKDPYEFDKYSHGDIKFWIREMIGREPKLEDIMIHTLLHEIAHYELEHDVKANKKIFDENIPNHNLSIEKIKEFSRQEEVDLPDWLIEQINSKLPEDKYQVLFRQQLGSFEFENEADNWALDEMARLKID